MSRSKWMELPRRVVIGSDAIFEVREVCRDLKLEGSALIVTGPTTKNIAGNKISDLLEGGGFVTEIFVATTSMQDCVNMAERLARDANATFLIGAGGGRSIDIAKLSSVQLGIPFLSIPTAASHDGICSAQASLTSNGETTSVKAQAPLGIVADTKIISKAPPRLLSAGCCDIISNCTAILDWQLAHRLRNEEYSEYAAALSQMTARMIIDSSGTIRPGIEESARVVMKALISSGVAMSIAGSSRPASGSEHKFAHAINMIAPKRALHGELCGLGTIIMMYLHGRNWEMIRGAIYRVGGPTTAAEVNIDDETVIEALTIAHKIRPERYTILENGLTREAAAKAAELTNVI